MAGVLVYLYGRPANSAYFLGFLSPTVLDRPFMGWVLVGQIPAFVHVFALILLTCSVLSPGRSGTVIISALWFSVDVIFEFGQHEAVSEIAASLVPSWFQHVPILEQTADYFKAGTFDWLDVASVGFGAVAGLWMSWRIGNLGRHGQETDGSA